MCDFKTGDKVLACNRDGHWSEKTYLYTRLDGRHVCQFDDEFNNSDPYSMSFDIVKFRPRHEERVIDPVRMMQWLVDHGYKADEKGNYRTSGPGPNFVSGMWCRCGGTDTTGFSWLPEWIEKVEVK